MLLPMAMSTRQEGQTLSKCLVVPPAAFFPPISLPKKCTGDSGVCRASSYQPAWKELQPVGVSGVECMLGEESIPKWFPKNTSRDFCLDDPWYSPVEPQCHLYNPGQHRMGFQAVPRTCWHKLSSSSCGHLDVSYSWEPNPLCTAAYSVQISISCSFSMGYFWMFLPSAGVPPLPREPTGCPSFPTH